MEKEVIIKIENKNKVVKFKEVSNRNILLTKNLKRVLKLILGISDDVIIKENNDEYIVYEEKEVICKFNIKKNTDSKYYLKIIKENICYDYDVTAELDEIKLNLSRIIIEQEIINSSVLRYENKMAIYILKNNNEIYIEIEDLYGNTMQILNVIKDINFEDSIDDIYKKIEKHINIHNIFIRKAIVLDKNSMERLITDLLILKEDTLIDYKNTINKNNRKYIISKENQSWSIKTYDGSVESLNYVYFELNDQINFIKKLEKKKEN